MKISESIKEKNEVPTEANAVPIELTNHGKICWVSKVDAEKVKSRKWRLIKSSGYVAGWNIEMKKDDRLSRWLLNAPPRLEVDHLNHNTLDNTRSNLKIKPFIDNQQNTKNAGSIEFHEDTGKWRARVSIYGANFELGSQHVSEQSAREAIDMFIVHDKSIPEDFDKKLNYPDRRPEYEVMEYEPFQKQEYSSKYEGVSYLSNLQLFQMHFERTKLNVRKTERFRTEEEAARRHDQLVVQFKQKDRLNFPHEHPDREIDFGQTYYEDPNNPQIVIFEIVRRDKSIVRVKIDAEDKERVSKFSWRYEHNYINRKFKANGQKFSVRLDKFILSRWTSEEDIMEAHKKDLHLVQVGHLDGNECNNCKSNLETNREFFKAPKRKEHTSQYIGVSYQTKDSTWQGKVSKGEYRRSMYDKSEEFCARWRDLMSMLLRKKPDLNFKDWTNNLKQEWIKKLESNPNALNKYQECVTYAAKEEFQLEGDSKKRKREDE